MGVKRGVSIPTLSGMLRDFAVWIEVYYALGGTAEALWNALPIDKFLDISAGWSDIRRLAWRRRDDDAGWARVYDQVADIDKFWASHPIWRRVDEEFGFDKRRGRPRIH